MDIYFDFSEYETAQAGATLALGGRPDVGLHLARMPESGLAFGGVPPAARGGLEQRHTLPGQHLRHAPGPPHGP